MFPLKTIGTVMLLAALVIGIGAHRSLAQDCTGDDWVDLADLEQLLRCYPEDNCCDVTGDGASDQFDLAFILAYYGSGTNDYGIEGYGSLSLGGSGPGNEVCWVTNLAESGSGSFRDALLNRNYIGGTIVPRIIKFAVGGTIVNDQRYDCYGLDRCTVDGYTAPFPGITLKAGNDNTPDFSIRNLEHFILRGIRVEGWPGGGADNIQISNARYVVVQHVSSHKSGDGAIDIVFSSDVSILDCFLYRSPIASMCSYGPNRRISYIRCVFAEYGERAPQLRYENDAVDYINCVVFYWNHPSFNCCGYGLRVRNPEGGYGDGITELNVIGCAFLPGINSQGGLHFPANAMIYGVDAGLEDNEAGNLVYVDDDNVFPSQAEDTYSTWTEHPTPEYAQPEFYYLTTELREVILDVGCLHPTVTEEAIIGTILERLP